MRFVVVVVSLSMLWSSSSFAATPRPAIGKQVMAATAHPEATKAALTILQAGGNAVDAAVAAAFAISVVEPFSAGIGGGGFAVVFDSTSKATLALDFRETAPAKATRDMYVDDKGAVVEGRSVNGWLSVAVPGVVPGLAELHKTKGKLPWAKVLQPAIDLASKGFVVGEDFVDSAAWRKEALATPGSQSVFTKGGAPLSIGDKLVQKDLAKTLSAIAKNPRAMHEGAIAKTIASEMKAHGGLVDEADLKAYRPTWRTPLCGPYKGLNLCTMPPPSSGGVHLLQMLRLLDGTDLKAGGWHDVDNTSRLIEAMRTAFADRAVWLGDPAFVDVPVAQLTSTAYAELRRKEIDPLHARKSSVVKAATPEQLGLPKGSPAPPMKSPPKKESQDTSHLTVVDGERNAVSLTFTVNYGFGSGVVVKGTGILLNDEMDDFAAAPGVTNSYGLVGGEANAVAAGKIPLSSMTPLIATRDGRFVLTAGAPGGSTIITTTLQTVLHVVDFGMDAQAAVTAPRIHQQWNPEATRIERLGLDAPTQKALEARGHTFDVRATGWGNAMCIVQRDDGTLEGGADPRGEGTAAGF
ncbi:MAG: gamma-glutamyltransferase [Deltaproteobacteria bacterium]|nr:gamma-glutamyltransferase [Deltaproteobacteria bacterium]